MSNLSWGSWAARVSFHIKFKPDRAGVEEELLAHLEDKSAALLRGGMTVPEAEQRALTEMGDADQVGRALAAVHKPWLGYLWAASKWLLAVCLIVLLCGLFWANGNFFESGEQRWWHEAVEATDRPYSFTELEPDCTDRSDGITFSIPAAAVIRGGEHSAGGDTAPARTSVCFTIRAAGLCPAAGDMEAFSHFYAVDDLGNVYPCADPYISKWSDFSVRGTVSREGFFSSVCKGWIREVDREARWLELRYDRDGRDVRLRIHLTGGDGG